MAPLHLKEWKPNAAFAPRCMPRALRQALIHIFERCPSGLWLVGGTALAAYYAKHRRSDDLDLFACDGASYEGAVRAVKSLRVLGAKFKSESTTPAYYRAFLSWQGHDFTVDVVLDEALHRVGEAFQAKDGVWVAGLSTLLAMKVACLVSRCSEKDLFDLDWLFQRVGDYAISDLIETGRKVDGGLTVETLLISLKGTVLRKEACDFLLERASLSVNQAVNQVFERIMALKRDLIARLLAYEQKAPASDIARELSAALKDQKKLKKTRV